MSKEANSSPLISVVIPVYNVEKDLHRCLDSVLAQTFDNMEVIVIDDGSTDRSGDICDEYAATDERLCVYHKKNEGVSVARNMGIEKAQGEYLLFVDSDDELKSTILERCSEYISLYYPDIILFEILWKFYNGTEHSVALKATIAFSEQEINDTIDYMIRSGVFYSPVNKMYKKSLIQKAGLCFDKNFSRGEDALFNTLLMPFATSIVVSNVVGYIYYIQEAESLSKKYDSEFLYQIRYRFNMLKQLYNKIGKKDIEHIVDLYEYDLKHYLEWLFMQQDVTSQSNRKKFNEIVSDSTFIERINHRNLPLNICLRQKSFRLMSFFYISLRLYRKIARKNG